MNMGIKIVRRAKTRKEKKTRCNRISSLEHVDHGVYKLEKPVLFYLFVNHEKYPDVVFSVIGLYRYSIIRYDVISR